MAEQNNDAQEKTHEATPRRLQKAREQGDMPRSQDAQTLAAYTGLAVAMILAGGWAATTTGESLMAPFANPYALAEELTGGAAGETLPRMLAWVFVAALPFIALPALLIVGLLVAQRGVVVAPSKLEPKLSRISPLANAKQKYGTHGLVEFAKSVVKLSAIGAVLGIALAGEFRVLGQYAAATPRMVGELLERQFWNVLTGVLIISAAIAFFDVIWQQLQFLARMRMSHQEIKEENKQSEGDPHMRAERRERARQIATNQMLRDVPNADVVITNPTHYAVALAWNRAQGTAPKCIAKGSDEIALRIRERAEEIGIPIQSDPPTARSIHALVAVGEEVRPEHYKAVAAAILFADKLRAKVGGPKDVSHEA